MNIWIGKMLKLEFIILEDLKESSWLNLSNINISLKGKWIIYGDSINNCKLLWWENSKHNTCNYTRNRFLFSFNLYFYIFCII